jgi:hypothetical protein
MNMGSLEELHAEINETRARVPLVLAMSELAILESDLIDDEVERIELELMDNQLELEESLTTLRIAGLLKD